MRSLMSDKNQELEAMRVTAERAGLVVSDEELAELSVGVKRNQTYAEAVRRFLHSDSEPGTVFGLTAKTADE
jgi:hypothetical protein